MYDFIVVGARCAGSPTAMLLARYGHSVLMVDKDRFPSDHAYSTLLLHPPGVACLRDWGVLDRVMERARCPRIRDWFVDVGPFAIRSRPPAHDDVDFGIAPRRLHLDAVLIDAARESGVEVRENYTIDGLVLEEGRVVGVKGANGVEHAKIVIGAEGADSFVAKSVKAPEYEVRASRVATYWAFWSGVQTREGSDMEFYPRIQRAVYAWPTSDNWMLIGANWSTAEFAEVSQDPEGNYWKVLDEYAPGLGKRMRKGKRKSEFRGGFTRNFYRKPYGEGWVLSGDAGCCYEFSSGQGITNAFRADQMLADALHEGLSGKSPSMMASLSAFEQRRNDAEFPYYNFTYEAATLQPPNEQTQKLFAQLAEDSEMASAFVGLFAQTTSPANFFQRSTHAPNRGS